MKYFTRIFIFFIIYGCSGNRVLETEKIYIEKYNETIFLKDVYYGGHEYIVVSQSNKEVLNEKFDYYIYNCHILYKYQNDTLILFGCEATEPPKNRFKTNIKIYPIDNLVFDSCYLYREKLKLTFFPKNKMFLYDNRLIKN